MQLPLFPFKECSCGRNKGAISYITVHLNYTILKCSKCNGQIGVLDDRDKNYAKGELAEELAIDGR